MYRLATKRTEKKTNRRKRERESFWGRQSGVHWFCYVPLFTDFENYWSVTLNGHGHAWV